MTELVTDAAFVIALAAVVSATAAWLATRRLTLALPVLLDLLLAASLLRLAAQPTPAQLLTTALLVLVKRLASWGVRRASAARRPALSA